MSQGPEERPSKPEGQDIFTEPDGFDIDTLRNLGPLAPLAGIWEGSGVDRHPVAAGAKSEPYRERMVFEVVDPQTNGPQLLYGLRYHVHINNDELLTFHDQVGYGSGSRRRGRFSRRSPSRAVRWRWPGEQPSVTLAPSRSKPPSVP